MDLKGRKVLVVGLARTGMATVRFLRERGAVVSTSEAKPESEMKGVASELRGHALLTEWGGHSTRLFLEQDLIILSPGVDPGIEPVKKALDQGIEVISEIELASRYLNIPMIAITGTNGKTTTTHLTAAMMKEAGKRVGVGGNVGDPLIRFVEEESPWELLVVEVSSFQLEGIDTFRPQGSVLLNITEDHLDRYPTFEDYIEAKLRIFKNQRPEDFAILNWDDPIVRRHLDRVRAKASFFSLKEEVEEGCFFSGGQILLRWAGREEEYSLVRSRLKGIHNVENMMAAILGARLFGASREAIQRAIDQFRGLEHRLEFVREVDGVSYYNDSKGTNVGSVVKSLQSFEVPVILIAGGKDKQTDLQPLKELIRTRVKRMILIGEARERMVRELGSLTETVQAETLEEAVLLAHQSASRGEVVLLSPACSSFDMFTDYQERGRVFKESVQRLTETTGPKEA